MLWKTRATELLGCKYPILQGAFHPFGTWQFAAAVSEAGAFGMITASVSRTPEGLAEDIAKCRGLTRHPFGVNLSFGSMGEQAEEMLDVCQSEKVQAVETATDKPDFLAARIKQSGLTWIHKSATVRQALHAEKLGADAVIVVGLEGTGFKHPYQLPTLTTIIWGAKQLKAPFIASGGIGDARGLLGALAMGADGVMMGTAFMATQECPMKQATKEEIVRARPDDPNLIHQVLTPPDARRYAEVMKLKDTMPRLEWLRKIRAVALKRREFAPESTEGEAILNRMISMSVGVIDRIPTVRELVEGIIREAEEMMARRGY